MTFRSVDSPHYHVWTDALHGRHMAENARNEWNRGTYVRWTIISAWTALEMTCEEALNVERLGNRFFERLDGALENQGLAPVLKGSGVWQQVKVLQQRRIDYVHRNLDQEELFATVEQADHAITTVRQAVKDLYTRIGTEHPDWVEDDSNPVMPGTHGTVTLTPSGVDPEDPKTIRIAFDLRGREMTTEYLPPDSDPGPALESLLRKVQIPIRAVRAYQGDELIGEIKVRMRGS